MPKHIAATKGFLLKMVRERGARATLHEWDGTTEEAIVAIMADPREVFAMDCDNHDSRGYCLGHPK